MAIKPKCDSCGVELEEYGAILLGPPDENDMAKKYHLCVGCYEKTLESISKK